MAPQSNKIVPFRGFSPQSLLFLWPPRVTKLFLFGAVSDTEEHEVLADIWQLIDSEPEANKLSYPAAGGGPLIARQGRATLGFSTA